MIFEFSCNIEYMNNWCESCPKDHVNDDNIKEDVESRTYIDELVSFNSGNHSIKFYKWMTINGQ